MSDASIRIAVIIPVYNTPATFLKESIESILSQDLNGLPVEIRTFVRDDGSTQRETVELLEQYASNPSM